MEKRGKEKREEGEDKLKVRSNDFFNMECIEVTLSTLVLTKRSAFDYLPSKSRK